MEVEPGWRNLLEVVGAGEELPSFLERSGNIEAVGQFVDHKRGHVFLAGNQRAVVLRWPLANKGDTV
ncbi:MAG: hypothetical protein ACLFS8_06660, partial [Clostridia bacterium]